VLYFEINTKTLKRAFMFKKTYHSYPVIEEELTAEEFIKLYKSNKEIIKSASPVLPKLGNFGYGKIKVNYRYPHFKTA